MQSFENLEEAQNIELDYPVVPWLTEMFHDNIVFVTDHLLPLARVLEPDKRKTLLRNLSEKHE